MTLPTNGVIADLPADSASFDPLELLARPDKWYVSGGRGAVFAPSFPQHLERPGLWDAAHYLHFAFEPVYTYVLLDERRRELPLRATTRRWRPDRLTQHFVGPGLALGETKVCTADDALVTEVTIQNLEQRPRTLQLVAWSAQPLSDAANVAHGEAGTATANVTGSALHAYQRDGLRLALSRTARGARDQRLNVTLALALEAARSYAANLSEPTANLPQFRLTPFYETLTADGLPNHEHLTGVTPGGVVYLGLERVVELPAEGSLTIRIVGALGSDLAATLRHAAAALAGDPVGDAERGWRKYFAGVPEFRCSDPYLERYYWYRWYGLRLNALAVDEGNYRYPIVCEGIGYFRLPISYSAPAHLRELRWQHDPVLARGTVRTYLERQTERGTFPAHLYRDWSSPSEIYHADWGGGFAALDAVHPAPELLPATYEALGRYADFFARERNVDGLYQIATQWETGQEYMSRYLAVDPAADEWRPMQRRLTGVDASVYLYRVHQVLAQLAPRVGRPDEAADWQARADATARALQTRCWSPEREAFHDLTPDDEPVPTLHGTSFYPYFTDIVGAEQLAGLRLHLLNPAEFWTPYPLPSSALDDPFFSATPEWKGKRHSCPWNGRTWPMVNSHIAEVLAHAAELDPEWREVTVDFVRRFVGMLFEDGDLERPNAYEHYNPITGQAAFYRGIDDYQHSWVVDLLIRFVAGLQPDGERLRVDPLPFGAEFSLRRVRLRDHWIDIDYTAEAGLRVTLDGRAVAHRPDLGPVELAL